MVHTNSTVHNIVGSGSNDPEKYDPDASRETLDHSLASIVAVALEDGGFHHDHSYAYERAHRPETIDLWRRVHSVIDPSWDALYRQALLDRPALGGRLAIHRKGGEKAVADAHTRGARPMDHAGYGAKFRTLAGPVLASEVLEAFLSLVYGLPDATPEALSRLHPPLPPGRLHTDTPDGRGIFDHGVVVTDR